MGVGLAAAVLIDATIVRAVAAPRRDEAARRVELVAPAAAPPLHRGGAGRDPRLEGG